MGEKTEYRDRLVENAFMGLFARKIKKYAIISSSGGKEKKKSSSRSSSCRHVGQLGLRVQRRPHRSLFPLARRSIRVTAVESVMQALMFLDSEHDVNMIVSDYCMPDMTGYDLLMEVKKSPKLAHLPVVIASSDNIPERIRKCLDGGAKDYILKPVKIVDLPRILNYI
ncbi:hypothetical protein OsI_29056 [Oryza sativa Indica Group]|uniref:Response regulatory domain-containing protein n=1 Tax=Oryza sativa subsp. indica TaxID=39946 RepID=A2YUQ2_ORYSI|nr:hypothetical protein OsI_29056 [Oryza sativa Indica Group]